MGRLRQQKTCTNPTAIDQLLLPQLLWLGAHIKSIANVKIIFSSSKISLVQENIIDNVHMHLLTKLLCRKRHKKTKYAESKEERT